MEQWPQYEYGMGPSVRSKPHHVTLPGCGEAAGRHKESTRHALSEELLQPITAQNNSQGGLTQ